MRRLVLRPEAQNDIAAAHNEARLRSSQRAQNLLFDVMKGFITSKSNRVFTPCDPKA